MPAPEFADRPESLLLRPDDKVKEIEGCDAVDALSEVLNVLRLEGAMFFHAEFLAPWIYTSAPAATLEHRFPSGTRDVIFYHFVTEGRGFTRVGDGERVEFTAGDVLMYPHGDGHEIGNDAGGHPVVIPRPVTPLQSGDMTPVRAGGSGEVTRFVCGYMAWERYLCQPMLESLPRLVKVRIRGDASGDWLENSIRHAVSAAAPGIPGSHAVMTKLSELLCVEVLRRFLATLPDTETGWLAGMRDQVVGRALSALHSRPEERWTNALLAKTVGVSRSVLVDRFRQQMGEAPISYLTRWRIQLSARSLRGSRQSVAEIAREAGYESEAAFHRAFKRHMGVPPAQFRKRQATDSPR